MARSKHGQLVAATVTTLAIDAYMIQITVTNRSQTGEIYFTVDGTTPVVGADGTYLCLGSRVVSPPSVPSATTVKLLSTGTPLYTVEGESA